MSCACSRWRVDYCGEKTGLQEKSDVRSGGKMRFQSLVLFLLVGVMAWPLVGQTNQTAAVKRNDTTEAKSLTPMSGTRAAAMRIAESKKPGLVETYGKLPMRFEANQGQTDANVKFLARGANYRLFLTGNE